MLRTSSTDSRLRGPDGSLDFALDVLCRLSVAYPVTSSDRSRLLQGSVVGDWARTSARIVTRRGQPSAQADCSGWSPGICPAAASAGEPGESAAPEPLVAAPISIAR